MTRVLVSGATGKLGTPIVAAISAADDLTLAGRIARSLAAGEGFTSLADAIAATQADVLIDVTAPEVGEAHALAAIAAGIPVVLGTTGLGAAGEGRIHATALAAGVPVLYVPNFAITAVLMMRFAAEAANVLDQCAIVEEHNPAKVDRPSGTALRTADMIEGVVANQSVIFGAGGQTLELRNVTLSREAFVPGALLALRRIATLAPGLHIGLEQILD